MRLTNRQLGILERLEEVKKRRKLTGKDGYYLDGQDCTFTLNSLVVRGTVKRQGGGFVNTRFGEPAT